MYSDDSGASEVESEDEGNYGDGGSDLASEIADGDSTCEVATMLEQQQNQKSKPAVSDVHEEAENDYSTDEFDDELEILNEKISACQPSTSRPSLATKAPTPTGSVKRDTRRSGNASNEASGCDYEYDEASFEQDSRRSQSQCSISQTFRSANRPGSNNNFIRTTSTLLTDHLPVSSAKTISGPKLQVLQSVAEKEAEALAVMQNKHFSLLLRKIESKFEDEVEELREKTALLSWKERELKATLRQAKEELTMRKARMEKKRHRAADRRREHERAAERVQQELATALTLNVERDHRIEGLQVELNRLRGVLENVERQKQEAEGRTMNLAEKLQTALGDYHQLTSSFQNAVNAKMVCEQRIEKLKGMHRVQLEVMEHKCQVDIEAAHRALAEEVAARAIERQTLPEVHQHVVEAEKERFKMLEVALNKQMHKLESRAAQDVLTHTAELARTNEAKHQAEQQAERRIRDEVDRIAREREAVDEQRRELLATMVRINARYNEDRGKLETRSCELDARRSELADECAEMKARAEHIEQRTRHVEESEVIVERRRTELAAVGRETLERSHALARRAQDFADVIAERDKLRCLVKALTERSERSEHRAVVLEQDREKLETAAHALEQERLLLEKQRVQSRYLLDGARKLESMLHQKHSAMGVVDKRSLMHPKAIYNISNQHWHHR